MKDSPLLMPLDKGGLEKLTDELARKIKEHIGRRNDEYIEFMDKEVNVMITGSFGPHIISGLNSIVLSGILVKETGNHIYLRNIEVNYKIHSVPECADKTKALIESEYGMLEKRHVIYLYERKR